MGAARYRPAKHEAEASPLIHESSRRVFVLPSGDVGAVPSLPVTTDGPEPTPELTGSGLAAERARRQAQVDDRRAAGRQPYPYRFDRTHTAADVRAQWGDLPAGTETDAKVAVAGRVLLKRDAGKLVFATITDRGVELQLFISRAVIGDDGFADVKELDRGDWVGVHGTVMTTRAGELSVKVDTLELLAKSIRPLPDKWHGLADPDTRFRQRYADLVVNAAARRAFEIRHAVISSFRRTLRSRGFVEVETPVLHPEAGGAHARPFVTHYNTLDMPMYLRVALELHLKRLIVGGMDRVFEIGRVFRNEGLSPRHNTEFTMMESYEAYADVDDVMELTEALIVTAARDALGTTSITVRGEPVDLAEPWPRRRMVDLVSDAIGTEVHPSHPLERMPALADEHGVHWEPRWGSGKLIEELFGGRSRHDIVAPLFVTGHPVEISPLARVDRSDPFLTERFELFMDAREIANGYSELNDPVEQRARFERGAGAGGWGCGSRNDRRGLPARVGVRDAADRRVRGGDGPTDHVVRRSGHDPRCDPVPGVATGGTPPMTRTAWGAGFTTEAGDGTTLDAWFRWLGWGEYGGTKPGQSRRGVGRRRPRRRHAWRSSCDRSV